MSDSLASRKPEDPLAPLPKAKTDSQLRLVTEDGADVFPDDHQHGDETPTMISRQAALAAHPTAAALKPVASESLLLSLRGRKLAHFELIEPIGVGGMAAVLRARDAQLDRFVALKILPPDLARDEESIRRFHQEARSAAKLDHENIARVFYCGADQNLHFIAFEFVEGDNLRTILERRGKLPVAEAVRYLLQIATGLEHAASRDVVHRDIKPSNIIITPGGRAKLVDMGLARSITPQQDQLTQSGMTLGTFDYISPEQALEPRDADARSDIYSLGCTFYHMLTGRAPVPEGTAGKKLHHHQHVMPIDPRQLNPEVPDEVAMVLGKMMAKNPRDRYQRPIQLVQHLMQVAHKVGVGDGLAEGALFVDAPLPTEPRKRPLLLVSTAALALVLLLMFLSLASPHKPSGPGKPAAKDNGERIAAKDGNSGPAPALVPPVGPSTPRSVEVGNEDEFKALMADATKSYVNIIIVNPFEITEPIVFSGAGKRTWNIEGKNEDNLSQPPSLRYKHQPRSLEATAPFIVDSGADVRFKNVRFQISSADTPLAPVASVLVRGGGRARFVDCTFAQKAPQQPLINERGERIPLAGVLADGSERRGDKPRIELLQCYFADKGQVAVGIEGSADVHAANCAFLPHGALFHLRGSGEAHVKVENCSAFVINGPAFRIDNDVVCHLTAEYSIFSCTDRTLNNRDEPDLIRHTDAKEPKLVFKGQQNRYHNLNNLWVWPSDSGFRQITSAKEFEKEIVAAGGADINSMQFLDADSVAIWKNPAPHTLDRQAAFSLNPDVRELRTLLDLKRALGVQQCAFGPMPALGPLPEAPVVALKLAPNQKVVDPTVSGRTTPGVFESVQLALLAARAGDEILLKHGKSRELDVEMTLLKKPNVDVTLRPYEGFQPILVLAEVNDPNASFFRLHDGRMTFENLEIILDPDQKFQSQNLVQLDGNASVTFKNCVLTLRQNARVNPGKTVPLTVVALPETDEAMMMMGTRPTRGFAEAIFHNCFVRGEGDVIANRAGRALDVQTDNTLVALTGAFLTMQGGAKETPPESAVTLRLSKSSFFLSEPFVSVEQGKHAKGTPPLRVERARECLFVPLEPKARPLIHLGLPDLSDATLRTVFDWKGAHNAYGGFEWLIDDGQFNYQLSPSRWKDMFYKDNELRFTRAIFELPTPPRQLWLIAPDRCKARAEDQTELAPYGAQLDADQLPLLPKQGES